MRRAAIADAAGQVRPFHSRYNRWLDGERRRHNGRTAWIKDYWQRDWIWPAYRLTGTARYAGQGRAKARVATRHGGRLRPGFCRATYRQLRHLADDQALQISRRIVNRAITGDCQAIVLEQLKGFRSRGGKRRSHLMARLHRWYHRMLAERIQAKALEVGIRTIQVWPRGTSAQAF